MTIPASNKSSSERARKRGDVGIRWNALADELRPRSLIFAPSAIDLPSVRAGLAFSGEADPPAVISRDKKQRAPRRSSILRRPALGLSVAQPNPSVENSLAIGSLCKGVNQIVHGRIGIARRQWRKIKSERDTGGTGEHRGGRQSSSGTLQDVDE